MTAGSWVLMSLSVLQNHNLADYTSWLVGGPAEYFCTPAGVEELAEALKFAAENKMDFTILGGGSNVLISDQGIPGLTICLKKFVGVQTEVVNNRLKIDCLS